MTSSLPECRLGPGAEPPSRSKRLSCEPFHRPRFALFASLCSLFSAFLLRGADKQRSHVLAESLFWLCQLRCFPHNHPTKRTSAAEVNRVIPNSPVWRKGLLPSRIQNQMILDCHCGNSKRGRRPRPLPVSQTFQDK